MFDLIVEDAVVMTVTNGTLAEGGIAVKEGKIAVVGKSHQLHQLPARERISAKGMFLCPGLVDCHTHLLEYATQGVHGAGRIGQFMAGVANVFNARKAGTVATGEHLLGHPVLTDSVEQFRRVGSLFPGYVCVASGFCVIGTENLLTLSSTRPGKVINIDELTDEDIRMMAGNSDFPGESLFLNATVANLPREQAPRAGEICLSGEQIKHYVDIFHAENKKIGAHIEGSEALELFLEAGGDVVHHGHGLTERLAARMGRQNVALVATPHGGTSSRPNSPAEIAMAIRQGVKVAIASDAYLPKHPEAVWLKEPAGFEYGPEQLLTIAQPCLAYLRNLGHDENAILALITLHPAEILGLSHLLGSIEAGKDATFLLAKGIPGLDLVDFQDIQAVYIQGNLFVARNV